MLYDQDYRALRRLLRAVRQEAGLSQVQLADVLGRGQSYVSKIERGEQYLDVLEFIQWCRACSRAPEEVIARI